MMKWTMSAVSLIAVLIAYNCSQNTVNAASTNAITQAASASHNSVLTHVIQASSAGMFAQAKAPAAAPIPVVENTDAVKAGSQVFQNNCAFCHGRDAAGGEEGPDLTRSKLVAEDKDGDKIFPVVRNGRAGTEMPAFNLSTAELNNLQAFIHYRAYISATQKGGRRGVDVSDLQTGNVEAGKLYFEGAGGCTKCHSATGDLAGIAKRYEGLALEQRMLNPSGGKNGVNLVKVTVTTAAGKTFTGSLAYQDEFTIGLTDSDSTYHSWPTHLVKFTVTDPVKAHIDMLPKYSDENIHDLMAYLQTLK